MNKKYCVMLVITLGLLAILILPACSGKTETVTQTSTQTVTSTATATTSEVVTTTETTTAGPQQYGGTLIFGYFRLPTTTLGWPATMHISEQQFGYMCYESLVRRVTESSYEPYLAESYEIAPDHSSITFKLRKGIKFHDGTDFNAEAVKFNLEAVKEAKHSGTNTWDSIEVIDDYTVRVNLNQWQNTALSRFEGRTGFMVSPTNYLTHGEEYAGAHPVGTGPFIFVALERDSYLEFKRFDGYWQEGKPYLDSIKIVQIKDAVTQVSALTVGDVDVVLSSDPKVLSDMQAIPGVEVDFLYSGVVMLIPDDVNTDSPLSNKNVRLAIDYAIDRKAIEAIASYGFFNAAYQVGIPGTMGYIPGLDTERAYDTEKAKQMLAESGWENVEFKLIIESAGRKDTQLAVDGFLSDIGIKCELELWDTAKYNASFTEGWHQTLILAPGGGRDLATAAETMMTNPNFRVSLEGPPGINEMVKEALGTTEQEPENIEKIAQAIYDNASLIAISYMGSGYAFYDNIFDHNFNKFYSFTAWTPGDTWMTD